MNSKKYKTGYVPGVFDLFHMGHLNLLKNSKERCEYLIAGVLTDELVIHFKKKPPMIPFEERVAIVEAIRYVDQVVPVTFENTYKIDAWHQLHYDCHFSGNDHGPDWENDLKQLRAVGSNMEFLQYTKGVSSSALKRQMKGEAVNNKLLLFGAGGYGRDFIRFLQASPEGKKWQIIGFLDNNQEKHGKTVEGYRIYGMEQLPLLVPDGLYTMVITAKEIDAIRKQLEEAGVEHIVSCYDFPGFH